MKFGLITALAFTGSLSLAVIVEPRLVNASAYSRYEGSAVRITMGDAQRLFADQFYSKADVYFHRGFYPSIFEGREEFDGSHADHGGDSHASESPSKSVPRKPDWIQRFSRSFYPSEHTHLGSHSGPLGSHNEEECDHPHHNEEGHDHSNCDHEDHAAEAEGTDGEFREILPWLKASAALDPNRQATYVTAGYWLRTRLNKPKEAEEFLWEGQQANPESFLILFELGRLYADSHQDDFRARNLWLAALARWQRNESTKEDPDTIAYSQILWQLALLEERNGAPAKAIEYLNLIKPVSPHPAQIQQRIDELQAKAQEG